MKIEEEDSCIEDIKKKFEVRRRRRRRRMKKLMKKIEKFTTFCWGGGHNHVQTNKNN